MSGKMGSLISEFAPIYKHPSLWYAVKNSSVEPMGMNIEITDDFDLKKIAESGQCFRWTAMDGSWRIPFRDSCLYISEIGGHMYDLDCRRAEFGALWRPYFDLDTDYRGIRGRIDPARDPFLFKAAQAEQGIRILRQDPWEALVSFIISQNRNIPAIRRSIDLLCRAAGERREDRRGLPYFTFPTPEAVLALDDAALEACRLGYRRRYVFAAAEAAAEGRIDLNALAAAPEEETMAALTGLFGVGIKVASCVSLFGLHHLDAFPVDVWMRRVLEEEYPAGFPFSLYRPFSGVCQQYLFAYYRNHVRQANAGN